MNGLYPIIRRKRRPLVVADTPPTMVGNVEPVPASAESLSREPAAPAAAMVWRPEQPRDEVP